MDFHLCDPNREPTVDELLNDPIARLLRHGDGLREADVRRMLQEVKRVTDRDSVPA